jgi:hypothetical protein
MAGGQWDFDGKEINVENIDSFSLFNLKKIIITVLFMEKLISTSHQMVRQSL